MEDAELRKLARAAKAEGLTVSEFVRGAIRSALERRPSSGSKSKLEAIRAAVKYEFPAPDMEQMNAEIASGYTSGWEPA